MGSVISFITGLASLKGVIFGLLGLAVIGPIVYFVFKKILKNKIRAQAKKDTGKKVVEDHGNAIKDNDKNAQQQKIDADNSEQDMLTAKDKLKKTL